MQLSSVCWSAADQYSRLSKFIPITFCEREIIMYLSF